jgi:metallo-beta-lactamase class B
MGVIATPLVRAGIYTNLMTRFLPLLFVISLPAQVAEWNKPIPPHKVIGNVYYVGTNFLASFLITTPEGHIVINPSYEQSVPLIQASVEKLGFKFSDVKILLISHAHDDHAAGCAKFKQLTGAKLMVMAEDVPVVEAGGKGDFNYPNQHWPLVKVDRVLHDGDEIKLGAATLVAHLTAGHTKGCTTWTMRVADGGRTYDVVVVGSPNVNPGFKLFGNTSYPQIAADYERMFRVLKSLSCDVFLGAHGEYYGMNEKLKRMGEGKPNPFIDTQGYKDFVAAKEKEFRAKLAEQSK